MKHFNLLNNTRWFATVILLTILGISSAWGAANDLVYTLSFSQLTSGTNYSSYGAAHTITGAGSKTWTVQGNQSVGDWLQVGGKSTDAADVIAVYNSSANITSVDIGKVVVTHSGTGGASLGSGKGNAYPTIYSVKLEVASNSDFSTITDTKTINNPSTSSDVEFTPTSGVWNKASYYRITYNYKTSNSNKNSYIKVSAVKFYEGAAASCSADPSVGAASINGSFFWTPLFVPFSLDNSWLKTYMKHLPYSIGPISYPAPLIYTMYISRDFEILNCCQLSSIVDQIRLFGSFWALLDFFFSYLHYVKDHPHSF